MDLLFRFIDIVALWKSLKNLAKEPEKNQTRNKEFSKNVIKIEQEEATTINSVTIQDKKYIKINKQVAEKFDFYPTPVTTTPHNLLISQQIKDKLRERPLRATYIKPRHL